MNRGYCLDDPSIPLRIGIAGPIATQDIASLLTDGASDLPSGYFGAPLLGTLIRELLHRGHNVSAFTTSSDLEPLTAPCIAKGPNFTIHICPARPRAFRRHGKVWGRAVDLFRLERQALLRAMHTANVDLVHAHWSYEFAMAAIESGLPSLITCHDAPEVVLRYRKDLYRVLRYFLARKALSRAKHVTVVSPYLKERIAKYVNVPIEVVPNPVVMPMPTAAQRSARSTAIKTPRLIMVINGWTPRKNARPALLAFSAFREHVPGAALALVGKDFEPGGPAHAWAGRHGLVEGMTFLGAMPHSQLLDLLEEQDLLVHPALEETFGMAIAESMARGVPVIGGANSGAVPWLIGRGGVVCDVSSPVAIAGAITKVFQDVETYQQYSDAARQEIGDRFAASGVAAEYEKLYRRCLDDHSVASVSIEQPHEVRRSS